MSEDIRAHFRHQADASEQLGSRFTASLCRLLADELNRASEFGRRILDWSGDPRADALALRACGALHALARSGRLPELTALYPPAPFDAEAMGRVLHEALDRHDAVLTDFLESPPQTNEVARSGLVLGAALHTVARFGLPLALYEIGASAALNLAFDQYRYDLGDGRSWGRSDAVLTIPCAWRGTLPPLDPKVEVVSRAGCDRNPIDAGDPVQAERLLSYIWPDQTARFARIEAALALAASEGRRADRSDAADWMERQLAATPSPGTCRFVFHTIVWQYLPAATQARIADALERAGEAATSDTPLVHFAVENDNDPRGADAGARMTLRIWPGDEALELGRGDFHGRWADWA